MVNSENEIFESQPPMKYLNRSPHKIMEWSQSEICNKNYKLRENIFDIKSYRIDSDGLMALDLIDEKVEKRLYPLVLLTRNQIKFIFCL